MNPKKQQREESQTAEARNAGKLTCRGWDN